MELRDSELAGAALTYLDEMLYPSDAHRSDTQRMAGACGLTLDDLYMLIHLAQNRLRQGGVGSGEVIEGLCRGTVAADEASRWIRALYALDASRVQAHISIGALSRTLRGIIGDGTFPDWEDPAQREVVEPLLRFALGSTACPPRPGIERQIDGSVRYTEPLLRKAVEDHPSQVDLILRLYCAEGTRLPELLETLNGSPALADGAL